MNNCKKLCFENLERREMMDAVPFGPPIPQTDISEPVVEQSEVYGPAIPLQTNGKTEKVDVVCSEVYTGSPEAPSDIVFGTYNPETKRLDVSWTDNSDNEFGFEMQYSIDGGETWKVGSFTIANNAFRTARGVETDLNYKFRIAAFNEIGLSDWTEAEWSYEESLKPSMPGEISFDSYDSESGKLSYSWGKADDSSVVYYPCEYSYDGVKWRSAGNVKANRNYRTATGVWNEGVQFRVCSKNADGICSDWVYATWSGDLTSDV